VLADKYRHELVALAHTEEAHKIGLLAFSTGVAVLRRRGRYQFSLVVVDVKGRVLVLVLLGMYVVVVPVCEYVLLGMKVSSRSRPVLSC
jgi:hypothetical protein